MDESGQILKKLLDICAVRHKVLAHNIANVNTPGYKRKDVSFRNALTKALKSRNVAKLEKVTPEIVTDRVSQSRQDGNNVSTQKELGAILENSLLYSVASRALSNKFRTLRKAMRGP